MIIIRSSLPETPKRVRFSKGRKDDEDDNILSFDEYANLPECILESNKPLFEPYKLIPCSVLHNIPPSLARA